MTTGKPKRGMKIIAKKPAPQQKSIKAHQAPPKMRAAPSPAAAAAHQAGINHLLVMHQKNLRAAATIQQALYEGLQLFMERQAAMIHLSIKNSVALFDVIIKASTLQEQAMTRAKVSRATLDHFLRTAKSDSETLAQCNAKVIHVVRNRVTEGMTELRDLMRQDNSVKQAA